MCNLVLPTCLHAYMRDCAHAHALHAHAQRMRKTAGMAGQPTAEKEDRIACKHVNRAVLPVLPRALQQ